VRLPQGLREASDLRQAVTISGHSGPLPGDARANRRSARPLGYELRTGSFPLFARSQKCRSVPMVHLNNRGQSQRLSQFRGVLFPNLFPNPAAGGPLSRPLIRLSPASRSGPEGRRISPTRWCAERSPLMPQHGRRAGVRHVSSYAIQRWSLPEYASTSAASRSTCSSHCLAKGNL
jgi:hypothetical protein